MSVFSNSFRFLGYLTKIICRRLLWCVQTFFYVYIYVRVILSGICFFWIIKLGILTSLLFVSDNKLAFVFVSADITLQAARKGQWSSLYRIFPVGRTTCPRVCREGIGWEVPSFALPPQMRYQTTSSSSGLS